jgi:hypothetical protein
MLDIQGGEGAFSEDIVGLNNVGDVGGCSESVGKAMVGSWYGDAAMGVLPVVWESRRSVGLGEVFIVDV